LIPSGGHTANCFHDKPPLSSVSLSMKTFANKLFHQTYNTFKPSGKCTAFPRCCLQSHIESDVLHPYDPFSSYDISQSNIVQSSLLVSFTFLYLAAMTTCGNFKRINVWDGAGRSDERGEEPVLHQRSNTHRSHRGSTGKRHMCNVFHMIVPILCGWIARE
jgi:hypothetical protein